MDEFTRDDLRRLVQAQDGPVVSIYMPTVRAGREVNQNVIRFKNLIKDATRKVEAQLAGHSAIQKRLNDARRLQSDDEWWQHQSDGLALFFSADRFDCFRLPLQFEEMAHVRDRFHVRPLIRLLQGDGRFYLLAASQNRVRLFRGSHFSIDELDPANLPADLRSALNIDEYTDSLQHHSVPWSVSGAGADAGGGAVFHGQGGADPDVKKKDEIMRFFQRINAALQNYFGGAYAPLVFAGVEYLFPIFRETCHYNHHLIEEPLTGNPDDLSAAELHRRAWQVVEPRFLSERDAALKELEKLRGGERATLQLEQVILAARQGAVDKLLLASDRQQWGIVDEKSNAVTELTGSGDGAEELLNYAACHTLTNSGTVYAMPAERMPDGKLLAATLRHPLPAT